MSKSIWRISDTEAGQRLDKWLADQTRLGSRSRALAALEKGQVFVNEQEQSAAAAGHRLQTGEKVRLWLDRPGSAQRRNYAGAGKRFAGLQIVFEDQTLLVINKPAGLLTVPLPAQPDEPSLLERVAEHLRAQGKLKPFIVHRIDRDTSGLVVFAKNFATQQKLKNQFERREPERIYWAFVYGHPQPETGTWQDELVWDEKAVKQRAARRNDPQKQAAVCRYRVLEKFAQADLLEVSLVTGKRNQIRLQASLRGHPLIGERKYVYENAPPATIDFPRQALHALRLSFRHPLDSRKLVFEAPLPADLQDLLKSLRTKKLKA
jgi:23S rRNA pseudouridine1911/1915/1917 synthase